MAKTPEKSLPGLPTALLPTYKNVSTTHFFLVSQSRSIDRDFLHFCQLFFTFSSFLQLIDEVDISDMTMPPFLPPVCMYEAIYSSGAKAVMGNSSKSPSPQKIPMRQNLGQYFSLFFVDKTST